MDEKKKDHGFLIKGPQVSETEQAVVRVGPDGLKTGTISKLGDVSDKEPSSLIRTEQIGDSPIYTVTDEFPSTTGGPALVNSQAFKDGWDSIFGQKQTVGQA